MTGLRHSGMVLDSDRIPSRCLPCPNRRQKRCVPPRRVATTFLRPTAFKSWQDEAWGRTGFDLSNEPPQSTVDAVGDGIVNPQPRGRCSGAVIFVSAPVESSDVSFRLPTGINYWHLNEPIGSTRIARRAGT